MFESGFLSPVDHILEFVSPSLISPLSRMSSTLVVCHYLKRMSS